LKLDLGQKLEQFFSRAALPVKRNFEENEKCQNNPQSRDLKAVSGFVTYG
jgi:hypothetical protein